MTSNQTVSFALKSDDIPFFNPQNAYFLSDASHMAIGGLNGIIFVLLVNLEEKKIIPKYKFFMPTCSPIVGIEEAKYLFESADRYIKTLICASEDGQLCIIDLSDGRCLVNNPKSVPFSIKNIKVNSSKDLIAVSGSSSDLHLFSAESLELITVCTPSEDWIENISFFKGADNLECMLILDRAGLLHKAVLGKKLDGLKMVTLFKAPFNRCISLFTHGDIFTISNDKETQIFRNDVILKSINTSATSLCFLDKSSFVLLDRNGSFSKVTISDAELSEKVYETNCDSWSFCIFKQGSDGFLQLSVDFKGFHISVLAQRISGTAGTEKICSWSDQMVDYSLYHSDLSLVSSHLSVKLKDRLNFASKDHLFSETYEKEISNVTAFQFYDDSTSPCIFTAHSDGSVNVWSNSYRLVKRITVNLHPVSSINLLPDNLIKVSKKTICFCSPFSIIFFSIDASKILFSIQSPTSAILKVYFSTKFFTITLKHEDESYSFWQSDTGSFERICPNAPPADFLAKSDYSISISDDSQERQHFPSPEAPILSKQTDQRPNFTYCVIDFDIRTLKSSENAMAIDFIKFISDYCLLRGENHLVDKLISSMPRSEWLGSLVVNGVNKTKSVLFLPFIKYAGKYSISNHVTSTLLLASMSLLKNVVDDKNEFVECIKYFNSIIFRKEVIIPSISFLIKFFVDPDNEIQHSSQSIIANTIRAMTAGEKNDLYEYWKQIVSRTPPSSQGRYSKGTVILMCFLVFDFNSLSGEYVDFVVNCLNFVIGDNKQSYFQIVAAEMIGKCQEIWKKVDHKALILKLIDWISSPASTLSVPAANTAKKLFLILHDTQIKSLIGLLDSTLTEGNVNEKIAVFRVVTLLIHKRQQAFSECIPWAVESAIRLLDPNYPSREAVFPFVTSVLHETVKNYGFVAYQKVTQKLALARKDGSIILYDLKTASKVLSMEGLTSQASSVAFSVEGKHVAAISRANRVLKIWTLPHGIVGLFSHTLSASRELSLSGDEPNSEIVWIAERSLQLMISGAIQKTISI